MGRRRWPQKVLVALRSLLSKPLMQDLTRSYIPSSPPLVNSGAIVLSMNFLLPLTWTLPTNFIYVWEQIFTPTFPCGSSDLWASLHILFLPLSCLLWCERQKTIKNLTHDNILHHTFSHKHAWTRNYNKIPSQWSSANLVWVRTRDHMR